MVGAKSLLAGNGFHRGIGTKLSDVKTCTDGLMILALEALEAAAGFARELQPSRAGRSSGRWATLV